jgi:hypothetical protein
MEPTPQVASARRREYAIVALVGVLVLGLHALVFGAYLPGDDGRLGHDYGYFFPRLLAGAYWFHENGVFSIPWFTPAFGGGLPFYAHPASGYVSFPQVAAIVAGPVFAVRATLVVFAALGFAGTYLLLRGTFRARIPAALVGATLFAWNGFFTARMLAGHLGFHSLMLTPLAAWWLTRPAHAEQRARRFAVDATCAGLVFAYMFQSGNFYGIPPAVIACVAIALAASYGGARFADFARRLAAASAIAVLLCLAKLCAALAFLSACPRDGYPLPGATSVFGALRLAAQSLFFDPPVALAREIFVNTKYAVTQHEWEFGLTWVAAILVLAGLVPFARTWSADAGRRRRLAILASLVLVLAVPIAVNVYTPGWNAFLKRVPIVQSSSLLVRWFAAYVPVFAVLAALALDRVSIPPRAKIAAAVLAIAGVLTLRCLEDRTFYANQNYRAATIENAFAALRATDRVPAIERADADVRADGKVDMRLDRDDRLANGVSQIACYEPMFGYGLEWFPLKTLHPGAARESSAGGTYNFKNPAGYLFPRENGLEPGGHFVAGQEAELQQFLHYRPFEFAMPARQHVADVVNLIAIAAVIAFFARCAIARFRRASRDPRP